MILNSIPELQQALGRDLGNFFPELLLCVGIVMMLLMRLFKVFDWLHLGVVAGAASLAALWVSITQWQTVSSVLATPEPMFSGLLVYDAFTVYLRLFLLGFSALTVWLTLLTGIPDREDSGDFYTLILGATLGMMLMASANHLLMVYIGVEMASLPSYALAGFLKGRRQSSEASLKYVVYGGGAAGVMLYGISLLAGKFGTAYLPDLAAAYAAALPTGAAFDPILLLGTLFILIGVAFKLAAFPFHFWCPDVFEGASAEVAGFLSVASKGAALALLARFVLMLNGVGGGTAPDYATWLKVTSHLVPVLALFAGATATFGNLAAYLQTNLKRLLAYSTIAHAGYMMMGLAAMNREGTAAVLVYLVAYLFMNLGAFAAVAFLRNLTGSEDLSSFRGLVRRAPFLVITLGIFLLSLLGLPPLAGFPAKFQIFAALFHSGNEFYADGQPLLGSTMMTLLVVGGLNTVLSVFVYLKVMKVMILDQPIEEIEGREPTPIREPEGMQAYLGLLAAAILFIGLFWGPLYQAGQAGVSQFRNAPDAPAAAVIHNAGGHR
jgi:NADH-quinone oxidoreductase subunit N